MSISAQVQGSRGHRRDAKTGGVTARDLHAEQADARDGRDADPLHQANDLQVAEREREDRLRFAACDRYDEEMRTHGPSTEEIAGRFDPEPILEAARRVTKEIARFAPSPKDDEDGLGDWLHMRAAEEIDRICRSMGWRSVVRALDVLEGFAHGAYGPALAAEAQGLLKNLNPWLAVAYAGYLPGLRDLAREI